jgi:oligopeptide/dipeptide ABC transporter ATP-binding protein
LPSSDDATRKLRSGSREPLLRVEGLHIHFAVKRGLLRRTVGNVRAVDGVDLRLLQGQTLALVGETGAGKSALVRGLVRLVPVHAGRVSFEGKDVLGMSKSDLRALARQIQTVTPEALLPNAASALAALLEQGAKLLIFDSAFDSISDRERLSLFEALRRAQDERGLTCLLLTRDLKLAAALAEDVAVMYRGQIVETGAAADVLARPQHPYTQALLGSKAADTTKSEPPVSGAFEAGCRFRMRCPYAFTRCAREEPVLFAVAGGTSRCFLEDPAAAGS